MAFSRVFPGGGGGPSNIAAPAVGATTLTGTAQPNAAVPVYKGSSTTPIGTAFADASGNWTLTLGTATALNDVYRTTGAGVVIVPAVTPLSISGANGTMAVGDTTSFTPTISGGTAPYTVSATGLPPGRAITNTATGLTTGAYTTAGTFNATYTVTDATGATASFARTVVITAAVETAYLGTTGYRFATSRPRPAINVGAVAAGSEYQLHRMEWYSPPYITREGVAGLPSHYTKTDSTTPSETAAPNVINIEGLRVKAFVGGSWVSTTPVVLDPAVPFNGAAAFSLDPAVNDVGTLVSFSFGVDIPPGTKMLFTQALNVPVGGSMITGVATSQATGRLDACAGAATSLLGSIDSTAAITGQADARIGGGMYTPAYIAMKPKNGLTTRVIWWLHDSKGWGRNMLEQYLDTPMLSCGFLALAMDESTINPRIPCGMLGVPSVGAAEWKNRTGWNRKLDLVGKCPNRPYTDIGTDHYNNGGILDANYRASFSQYYDLLLTESRRWGDSSAKLHQTRPIPSPSSTDHVITLANQPATGSNLASFRFAGFDADLVSGYFSQLTSVIDVNRDYAYDQMTNRDKVKLNPKSFTVNQAFTTGTSLVVNELPALRDRIVLDPTANTGATYVRSFTGTGPYTLTTFPSVTKTLAVGDVLKATYVGDRIGLHPADAGHAICAVPVAEWKARLAS